MRKFTIAHQDYVDLYALIELTPGDEPAIHRGLFATREGAQEHADLLNQPRKNLR